MGEIIMEQWHRIRGCGTALVTPFRKDGSLDEVALLRLVDFQIAGEIDFLVACGTTGESATLSREEQARVISLILDAADGRVPVVAGVGGYDTREVIERMECTARLGVDAFLSVTPYYNKPTQEGLYRHFQEISKAGSCPVILYNVPGRTACNLEPDTVARLAGEECIRGIKEASGNISQIGEIAALTDDSFKIFAGDDSIVVPVAALGGSGVISVASNLEPQRVSRLAHACVEGRFEEARKLNAELTPLFKAMFLETNPIPVKAALVEKGMIEEVYRLPLVPLSDGNRSRLQRVLGEFNARSKPAPPARISSIDT